MDIEINAPLVRSVTVEKMTGLSRVQLHRLARKGRLDRIRKEVPTWASTENQTITLSDFQFDAVDVAFSRVSSVTYVSRQLLKQCTANRNLLGVVSEHLTKSIAYAIDKTVFIGNGLSFEWHHAANWQRRSPNNYYFNQRSDMERGS